MADALIDILPMLSEAASKYGGGADQGRSLAQAPKAPMDKKIKHSLIHGPSKLLKLTADGGKAASKMSGVSFGIASMLKQSQIFTGVVGSIFQIIGAMIDMALLPLIPVVVPIIKTMGSVLKVQGRVMRDPGSALMMVVKKLPIMGPLISVAMKVKDGMSFITGPDGIIAKIRASFHDFKETFGTRLKIAGLNFLKLPIMYYKQLFEFLSKVWGFIGDITIPLPKMMGGPFQPFAGIASAIQTPLDGLVGLLQGAETKIDEQLVKLNSQLEGVIGPDGLKVYGDNKFAQLDLKFGGADVYRGYNATEHGTNEQFRMLMGGEELG